MRRLDISKLKEEKTFKTISSEESLKDITPIDWSEEVLSGNKKIEIGNLTDEEIYKSCRIACGDVKREEVLKNKKLLKILKEVDK